MHQQHVLIKVFMLSTIKVHFKHETIHECFSVKMYVKIRVIFDDVICQRKFKAAVLCCMHFQGSEDANRTLPGGKRVWTTSGVCHQWTKADQLKYNNQGKTDCHEPLRQNGDRFIFHFSLWKVKKSN